MRGTQRHEVRDREQRRAGASAERGRAIKPRRGNFTVSDWLVYGTVRSGF